MYSSGSIPNVRQKYVAGVIVTMSFAELNSKADIYYAAPTSFNFHDMYYEAAGVFKDTNRMGIVSHGAGDYNDADEIFDKVIFSLSRKRGIANFSRTMSSALKKERLQFFRNEHRRRNRYEMSIDDVESPNSDIKDEATDVELIVISRLQRKEANQRRTLIDFLTDPDQVDSDTTLIVSSFSQYESITALAKALGLHHEVVKRKLRRLSRRYDANRFGDIQEYLAV